jgi:hypothetical protein
MQGPVIENILPTEKSEGPVKQVENDTEENILQTEL